MMQHCRAAATTGCTDLTVHVLLCVAVLLLTPPPHHLRLPLCRFPCPINYAALSPDGQHLVAVGDCNQTLVYQATPTGADACTDKQACSGQGHSCTGCMHAWLNGSTAHLLLQKHMYIHS
jgi:hypothetical protein